MEKVEKQVTGLSAVYQTPDLIKDTVESIKEFYPELELILVNNSPEKSPCTRVLKSLEAAYANIKIIQNSRNLGHGLALNIGMQFVRTPFVYIFDSDIVMIRGEMLEQMIDLMSSEIYGIGFVLYTSRGGSGVHRPDVGNIRQPDEVIYIHPFSCVFSTEQYWKFPKFNSTGAPFCDTMSAIFDAGKADEMLLQFPVKKFIRHLSGGTRGPFGIPYVKE